MTTDQIIALVGAITALITAVGGIIAIFRHVTGPAHKTPPPPVAIPRPPLDGAPR